MADGPASQADGQLPASVSSQRGPLELLLVAAKGLAMGAADIVPGVSGGTVAFITGIYEELLQSIRSLTPAALAVLWRQGPASFWRQINGSFLLALLLGIGFSALSLAGLIGWLLAQHPIPLWSFFFGLILYSAWHIWRQAGLRDLPGCSALLAGAVTAWAITELAPASIAPTPLNLFLAGALAICAMILPGVSGSFILVLLGMYAHVIAAIEGLELLSLALFAGGCLVGLLSFSHLLGWLLARFHALTLAVLTGFMLGSLNRVWPWKQTLSWRVDRHGEPAPLVQANVLPGTFQEQTGQDPQLLLALACLLLGLVLVAAMEWLAGRPGSRRDA